MSRNLFVGSRTVAPPCRWADGFPGHLCVEPRGGAAAARPGDVLWVPTTQRDWQALVGELRRTAPQSPVVVLTLVPEADEAIAALEQGARAYCHALAAPGLLHEVEVVVRHGGLWVGPELMARVVGAASRALAAPIAPPMPAGLSAREIEVARAATAGLSNKEIAERLGITERTVKAHMGAIFEKLGVRDRLQLVLRLSASANEAVVASR